MDSMRNILRESLAKSLEHLSPLDRLSAAWPVAAGHSIASRSAVAEFRNGVCHVQADSPWIAHLQPMAENLRRQLEEIAHVKVRALHFQENHDRDTQQSTGHR